LLRKESLLLFVAFAGFGLLLSGQEQQPANPSFQVSVNLVQVDAVVTDSKGHAVRDLRQDDFEILEDGKPETITHFSWIDVAPPPAASPASAHSGPAGAPPARTAQSRTFAAPSS